MDHLNKLISNDLVIVLPNLKFEKDHMCEGCQKGKQTKQSFKLKKHCLHLKTPWAATYGFIWSFKNYEPLRELLCSCCGWWFFQVYMDNVSTLKKGGLFWIQ